MAIAQLSTLAANKYRGGAGIQPRGSSGDLLTELNLIIAKVNEVITGLGTDLSALTVLSGVGSYYSGDKGFFSVVTGQYPTAHGLRLIDWDDGAYKEVTLNTGVVGNLVIV